MGTEAQDSWCEQVLDFIPPARRRGPLRAELRARRDAASATLAHRIADAPGLAGEGLALRAGILAADLDRALAEPDLLDDSVTPGNFVTAVNSASAILDEMVKVAGETTALPGQVKAEADTRRAEIRNRLNDAFAARLAAQGAQQTRILAVLSPDQLDLDLRKPRDAVRAALASPDLGSDTVSDGVFRAAAANVQNLLNALKPLEDRLAARALAADTKAPAVAAIDAARTEQQKTAPGPAFGDLVPPIGAALVNARNELLAAKDAAAGTKAAQETAAAAQRALAAITAAAAVHAELDTPIATAVGAADATPGAALRDAWSKAVENARAACRRGEDGAAGLRAVQPVLEAVTGLTAKAKALRERGATLAGEWRKRQAALGADQKAAVGNVTALIESLKDIAEPAWEAAEKKVTDTEKALKDAAAAYDGFKAILDRLNAEAAKLPAAARVQPAKLFAAELTKADAERTKAHDQGKLLLDALDSGFPDYRAATEAMAELDRRLQADKDVNTSMGQTVGVLRAAVGKALAAPRTPMTSLRGQIEALLPVAEAWQVYHAAKQPLTKQIEAARKIRGASANIQQALKQAEDNAAAGKVEDVRAQMKALPAWLEAAGTYADTGKATVDAARDLVKRDLPKEVGTLINSGIGQAQKAINSNDFIAAMQQAVVLAPLLGPAGALAKSYAAAAAQCSRLTGVGVPAQASADKQADSEFEARLLQELAGLTPDASDLGARAKRLDVLTGDVTKALIARRKQVQDDLAGGSMGKDKAAALFADDETAQQAARLYAEFGKVGLDRLLSQVGSGADAPAAGARATRELGELGPDQVRMLQAQLGDIAHVGKLCAEDGGARLPSGLAEKFAANPGDLGTLMQQGVGNDIDRFAAVIGRSSDRAVGLAGKFKAAPNELRTLLSNGLNDDLTTIASVCGGGDATQIKALSDGFPARAELARLVGNLGGKDSGPVMKTLAGRHFGDDWSKLKAPFFDTLAADADGDRLMSKAKQFEGKAVPPLAIASHGFSGVAADHVYKRHAPANFDFDDIKDSNTQFAETLRPEIPAICGEAIAEVRKLLNGNASNAVEFNHRDSATFPKFTVTLPGRGGLRLQVGYSIATNTVDQVMPISGDQYSDGQMSALKAAFGK